MPRFCRLLSTPTEQVMRRGALATALATTAFTANAQDGSGDPEAGRAFAREVCKPCHAVTIDQVSPRRFVIEPDFQAIAATSGMTATSL